MAIFTDIAGRDMRRLLAGGGHSIVTAAAIANDAKMIEVGRNPPSCRMAVITGIGTGYVRRMFAGGSYTIVAGSTGADDLSVIDCHYWRKGDNAMAIFANCRGLNMRSVLAGRLCAVVTADAIACDIDVIKVRRSPGHSRVAIVTGISAGDVRRILTGCDIAIVARLAGSYDLSMVDHGRWRPEVHAMAIFAYSRGLYVRDIFARSIRAVVAAGAIAGNARVVEVRWRPGNGRMAIVAVIATR